MDEEISFEDLNLKPVNFFAFEMNCYEVKEFGHLSSKHLLPDLSELNHETTFADVSLGWNRQGIVAQVKVNHPYVASYSPKTGSGDGIEIFLDTRDLKSAGFNTRFCHHFLFTPEGGIELTHFRTEDAHDHCNPAFLVVKAELKKSYYILNIFIPSQCLYGYDPDQFSRMGFAYRINSKVEEPQHFCVNSNEYQIDQNPSLWSSLILIS